MKFLARMILVFLARCQYLFWVPSRFDRTFDMSCDGKFSMEFSPIKGLAPERASAMSSSEVPILDFTDFVGSSVVGRGGGGGGADWKTRDYRRRFNTSCCLGRGFFIRKSSSRNTLSCRDAVSSTMGAK